MGIQVQQSKHGEEYITASRSGFEDSYQKDRGERCQEKQGNIHPHMLTMIKVKIVDSSKQCHQQSESVIFYFLPKKIHRNDSTDTNNSRKQAAA